MKPLVLWGGVDINPEIYKQKRLSFTQIPQDYRDFHEIREYHKALLAGIPVVGVCRGAQLLCALNGGTLIQHSRPHDQCHSIQTKDGFLFPNVEAGHHQIMQPAGEFELLGWNPSETQVWYDEDDIHFVKDCPEVVWWPKSHCLGIQPHPEWSHNKPWVEWINNLLKEKEINFEF